MRNIQDKSGSYSVSTVHGETGDFGYSAKDVKAIIREASKVEIIPVLKSYGIQVDEYVKKALCPFHQERTPSFWVYKDTNSFYCFGCKVSGDSVEFVSKIEDVSRYKAARKLLSMFEPNSNFQERNEVEYAARNNLFIQFSTIIRKFIQANIDDMTAIEYADKIGLIFDVINEKHSLDNEGIQSLIEKLKIKIEEYANTNSG
jgi:DNA primase